MSLHEVPLVLGDPGATSWDEELFKELLGTYSCRTSSRDGWISLPLMGQKNSTAEKINGRMLFPSSHVAACDFIDFVESFFWNFPRQFSHCTGEASQLMEKTPMCKKVLELPGWTSSLIGQKNIFSGQSEGENSTTSRTGSVRISSQGLFSSLNKTFAENITSSLRVAHGSPRM